MEIETFEVDGGLCVFFFYRWGERLEQIIFIKIFMGGEVNFLDL